MDYYLKAESEQALWAALEAAGAATTFDVKDEQGNVVETRHAPTAGYSIDIIGTIYKPTGNLIQKTVEGVTMEVPEMAALDGFHANLRGPADLAPKVEITEYVPTVEDLNNPDFVKPEPTRVETPSPIQNLLVFPQAPVRVWF